ncbi:MAG: response regulator transcription factor [Verrucomicrobiota bacterium]|nr:response regulator transcription factor [Verrucomicrobiota bacterium]
MKRISILLADDHSIVRTGFHKILDDEKDFLVIGEAKNGREAIDKSIKLSPDIVLMDIGMPILNGLEATRQICKTIPKTKVLILSAFSEDAYFEKSLEAGASGFLIKQSSADVLARAIRQIYSGSNYFSPLILLQQSKNKMPDRLGKIKKKNFILTSREIEVLQLIAEGKANKQTADELSISIKTVEKHRSHLMEKLNIHETAGLTRYAITAGIISCDVSLTITQD